MPERYHVTDQEDGQRLDQFLTSRLNVRDATSLPGPTRSQIKRAIDAGAARVDGQQGRPGQRLRVGQTVDFTVPTPEPLDVEPEDLPLDIVYEDEYLIVVDKAAGMVVHPAAGHRRGTLVAALLSHCQLAGGELSRPGIVHRLDKDTSGLLVITKDVGTHEGLAKQFRTHSIDRRYLALTRGVPSRPHGTISTQYGRHPTNRLKFSGRFDGARHAVTHYEVREHFSTAAALVGCELETGRTHQVRVHLSELGHPILGDKLYGGSSGGDHRLEPALKNIKRQALHAALLGFDHPATGDRIELESKPPQDFDLTLEALRSLR